MGDNSSSQMECPNPTCKKYDNIVLDTRSTKGGKAIKRRKLCRVCETPFSTIEEVHVYVKENSDERKAL